MARLSKAHSVGQRLPFSGVQIVPLPALSNSGTVSGVEPLKTGFYCSDLFIDLTDRSAEVTLTCR
jgi:hypothetical protein